MEMNKQLNFSAPLLSARRYSSPLRSSSASIEQPNRATTTTNTVPEKKMKTGGRGGAAVVVVPGEMVVKPASVPFLWEQIPGRAKNGSSGEPEEGPTTTHLPPPARFRSGDLTSLYRSSHQQHRLSGELNSRFRPQGRFYSGELRGGNPAPPNRLSSLPNPNPNPNPIPTNEMAVRTLMMDGGFDLNGGDNCSRSRSDTGDDDDDGDTSFSDAIDGALESSSMKCSTTGVSDHHHHHRTSPTAAAPVNKPLCSQSELDNREFMINRFLPAAKAMTLDSSPHYTANTTTTTKKQLVVVEQPPKQQQHLSKAIIPKIVKSAAAPVSPRFKQDLTMTLYTGREDDNGSEEDEDDDFHDDSSDEFRNGGGGGNHHHRVNVKSCGFFPWFCSSKSALRLLNPVPAMKVKTKNALAVGRNFVKNASPGRSFSSKQPVSRTSRVHKLGSTTKSCELRKTETQHHHQQPPPKYYKPRPMFYSGELPSTRHNSSDLQSRNGHLSPYRNYRRSNNNCVSPVRNESGPRSPYHYHQSANTGYFIVPKRVDHHHPNTKPMDNKYANFSGPILPTRRISNYHHPVPPPGSPVREKTVYVDSSATVASAKVTNSRQSSGRIDILKARGMSKPPVVCGTLDASPPSPYHSFAKKNSQREKRGTEEEEDLKSGTTTTTAVVVAPPPLPKSPSESWLSRNLNSPRNSFGGGGKVQSRKQSPVKSRPSVGGVAGGGGGVVVGSFKWETIVKSSYLMSDHGLYPEEPVTQVVVQKQK